MNTRKNIKWLHRVVLSTVCAALPCLAVAQSGTLDFPKKPVRLILSTAPSGGTDFLVRLLAQKLNERWAMAVVVENRPGASGLIAMENIAASPPDGYSLGTFNGSHLLIAQQSGKLSFENNRDFTPVALPAATEFVFTVHPGLGVKTMQEFIALAKAKPNTVNYISSGVGTVQHLSVELLDYKVGMKLTHVPYQGGGASFSDFLSGRVQVNLISPTAIAQYVKTGQLLALAISGAKRSAVLPDVPTFDEIGVRDYDITNWWAIFGPGKMAPALVNKINADFNWVVQQPDIIKRLNDAGMDRDGAKSAKQVADYAASEIVKWNEALKVSGLR